MQSVITFELHRLGWHGFQQLCHTITREVWGQTVEAFLDGNDGGRDGAFTGTWSDAEGVLRGQFVVQCKHTSRPGATLARRDLKEDIAKAEKLVASGRCDHYVLMTNAGVSGRVEGQLAAAFKATGVKQFRCYGSTWINQVLTENKRLRMLVPRVYGLGDLTQILDERSYAQAQAVLESMRTDLAKVVRTGTYDKAARSLYHYGFVLLLGDPATGKSTIAAQLALAGVDLWSCSAIKLDDPADFGDRWNPYEPQQFFWVDDVFGSTQFDLDLAQKWTRAVPLLQSAVQRGARIVATSRDYIYRAARPHLKPGAFPLLDESKVVVDVRDLTPRERREILYNHLKHGSQPRDFLMGILGYLDALADHPDFTPELARRLSSPAFTSRLEQPFTYEALVEFFTRPIDFLADVINGLDDDSKAGLGLIYVHRGFLPSPIALDRLHEELLARLGGSVSGVTRALANLKGSLVSHTKDDAQSGWSFAHPSLIDAYADSLRTPELMHLLAAGFPLSVLVNETTCGDVGVSHAIVFPATMYGLIMNRFNEPLPTETQAFWRERRQRAQYLAYRCDREFLQAYIDRHPDLLDRVSDLGLMLDAVPETDLSVRLHELGLLPEANRLHLARTVMDYFVKGEDPGALTHDGLRGVLSDEERENLRQRIVDDLVPNLDEIVATWHMNYDSTSGPPESHYRYLVELIETASEEVAHVPESVAACKQALHSVNDLMYDHDWNDADREKRRDYLGPSAPSGPPMRRQQGGGRSIFDDLLD